MQYNINSRLITGDLKRGMVVLTKNPAARISRKKILYLLFSLVFISAVSSCKKLVEISEPINSITTSETFSNDANATSAIVAIYSNMSYNRNNADYANGEVTIDAGLSADELIPNGNPNDLFWTNSLLSNTGDLGAFFWNPAYFHIYMANAAIEGLQSSNTLSESVKGQLIGEAKFLRSFSYFYLLNLFGDVPLATTSSFATNSLLHRTPREEVYQQIIDDLKEAQELLPGDYSSYGGERIRATKWAAMALLARVYLYTQKYDSAEIQASRVIDNSALFDLVGLNDVFLKNNMEAIWQLQVINAGNYATYEAHKFIPGRLTKDFSQAVVDGHPDKFIPSYYLSDQLLNAFEADDHRKLEWTDSTGPILGTVYYYPYKYKVRQGSYGNITEYYTPLRLAEQFLIRAEARARQNNLDGAISDLNRVRGRAGLLDLVGPLSQQQLLDTVSHERQVELFAENGNRWFDLKRSNQADAVLTSVKGASWQTTDQFWPIPEYELKTNPNLSQNPGY